MIKKIIKNLKEPHKIPGKILNKLIFLYKKGNYRIEIFEEQQNKKFKELNLDRPKGQKKLKEIKDKYDFLDREMASEHEVLFASLSSNTEIKINKVLEIGTFDGLNAFLLSKLFDNSHIETIDLDENDEDFKNFYNRKDNLDKFIIKRNDLLYKSKNINFQKKNSIKLILDKNKYDLIWIDGAHGYPTVCIDIINSLKIINENGFIMVDDIYIDKVNSDRMYDSNASFETLNELKKGKIINYHLIYKRLDKQNNCVEKKRKYVALVKKI